VIVGSSVRGELADKTAEAVDTGRTEITDLIWYTGSRNLTVFEPDKLIVNVINEIFAYAMLVGKSN